MQTGQDDTARRLVELVQRFAADYRHGMAIPVRLDSSLEQELGLDSLARVELLARIEHEFGLRLDSDRAIEAETPGDLLRALVLPAAGTAPPWLAPGGLMTGLEPAEAEPEAAQTLQEMLAWHVAAHPRRTHVMFYATPHKIETLSYEELQRGALALAAALRQCRLRPGQAVAIMLPTCLDFFLSFYAVLFAGGVPVPLYPPARASQVGDHLRRQSGILANCQAPILITSEELGFLARVATLPVDTLQSIVTVPELRRADAPMPRPETPAGQDATALLQYTSGSTGNPKGVVLSHRNLLANIRAWSRAAALTPKDVCVSWLPLYHDMGLIGTWLGSLCNASLLVLMPPQDFLAQPRRWLWAIHRHRGTVAAAPNFAYELCLRHIENADLEGIDLSSWRLAANGAEPVSAETITRFSERFAPWGFRASAMLPLYGLAENSVGLTMPPLGRVPRIDQVRRDPLLTEALALPAAAADTLALRLVSCGHPLPAHEVRIVDADGRELPERHIGRLEFRGPSATRGYFRNDEETRRLLHQGWLDSGDLAYIAQGEVFITGRIKDMIIRGGRNLYPYELEQAIGQLPGIRQGCVAIFGSRDPGAGTERLVVVAETRENEPGALSRLAASINGLAVELLGAPPDDVVLAAPRTIPKTSSGKIRRNTARDLYQSGALTRHRPPWLQLAALAAAGIRPRLGRARRHLVALAFGAYAWLLLGLLAGLLLPPLLCLPTLPLRWALGHNGARLLFRLCTATPHVRGTENLPARGPYVIAANHASYLDGLLLVAALGRPAIFVAKRELHAHRLLRMVLRRLGVQYVERFTIRQSIADAQRLALHAGSGPPLLFFPEGTFSREPGLRPFHMGAFVVAARSGIPVVPVALAGTRSALRDGTWLPRRGPLDITVMPPIAPGGPDWRDSLRLRAAVRGAILRHCGEPEAYR